MMKSFLLKIGEALTVFGERSLKKLDSIKVDRRRGVLIALFVTGVIFLVAQTVYAFLKLKGYF